MRFVPTPPPATDDIAALRLWISSEFERIAEMLEPITENRLEPQSRPPYGPSEGQIVFADGTNWNPGAGAGFYGYQAGAWVKL